MRRLTAPTAALILTLAAASGESPARAAQADAAPEISIDSAKLTGVVHVPPGPEYLHRAVFYQIYPQSFYDTNADGIGDLEGVIRKLDYVRSLGVDGFWINPFFESPFRDAGYDISDYYKVAPRYGTNEDARRMFAEADKRGLKVLFDWVISYTSTDHPWFQDSAKQETNAHSNWYIWTDNTWKNPPEAYKDAFIKGYGRRNGQFMRNFFWSQPALNFGFASPSEPWMLPTDHPDVLALQEELKRVLRFWMDMGAKGFRADMAGALVKTEHVTGNDQFFTTRGDGTKLFWRKVRALMDREYPGSFMVAEWSHPESALGEGGFHADFFHWFPGYNDLLQKEGWRIQNGYSEGHSFFDKEGKGSVTGFLRTYLDQYRKTVGKGYINLPLGNHDLSRLNIERSTDDLEQIYAFSLTMPGIPFIFQGNEIGMRQLEGQPFVEGAYKPRAGGRSPMQWNAGKNLGFSEAAADRLYLPVDPAADAPNVEAQEKAPDSLLKRVRRLIQLRKTENALAAYAEFLPVYAKPDTYPFVYARANGDDAVLVILNPAERPAEARFRLEPVVKSHRLLSGHAVEMSYDRGQYAVKVPGRSYAIYRLVGFKGTQVPAAASAVPAVPPTPAASTDIKRYSFLYAGEWDTRKPMQSMFIVRNGKVDWSYSIPLHLEDGGIQEFDDATLLPNGNVLFSRMSGAGIVSPERKLVWNYPAPPGTEIHSAQPLEGTRVLIMRNGNPAKALIIDTATNAVVKEVVIPTPITATHGQFRHVRMTKSATLLVPHLGEGKVMEYDLEGKVLWSVSAPSPWSAVRLANGNTLIAGDWSRYVREVNAGGETVWELTQKDVPEITLGNLQTANRLANGDTVIANWCAGDRNQEAWKDTVQVFEVTPDKKVVWKLSSWEDPDLGPSTSIQLLEGPGVPPEGDVYR